MFRRSILTTRLTINYSKISSPHPKNMKTNKFPYLQQYRNFSKSILPLCEQRYTKYYDNDYNEFYDCPLPQEESNSKYYAIIFGIVGGIGLSIIYLIVLGCDSEIIDSHGELAESTVNENNRKKYNYVPTNMELVRSTFLESSLGTFFGFAFPILWPCPFIGAKVGPTGVQGIQGIHGEVGSTGDQRHSQYPRRSILHIYSSKNNQINEISKNYTKK